MNKEKVFEYIKDYMTSHDVFHTDTLIDDKRMCMAWSTRRFYADVEVYNARVEITISPQRKEMSVYTISGITDPSTDEDLNEVLNILIELKRNSDE